MGGRYSPNPYNYRRGRARIYNSGRWDNLVRLCGWIGDGVMPLGSFKAALLGAAAGGGDTYWAGLYYTQRSSSDFAKATFGAVDSEGDIVF